MLHIYYGDITSSSSFCMGLALYEASRNKKTFYISFLNSEVIPAFSSIIGFLPNLQVINTGIDLNNVIDNIPEKKSQIRNTIMATFNKSITQALTQNYDIVVLEGIFTAVDYDLLHEHDLYELLSNIPNALRIVCTGNKVSEKFFSLSNKLINITDETNNN